MAKKKEINGKVVYQNLEGGFWGIIDDQGNQYLPVNMPEQLKYKDITVSVVVKPIEDGAGTAMWGRPVYIVSFSTVTP